MSVPYPENMHRLAHKLPSVLRASFLLLLALGVMARPVLNQLSALHDVEHATLAGASGHGHGHDHPGDQKQTPDPDESTVGHELLHQADTGSSANIWTSWISLNAIPLASTLPLVDLAQTRTQRLASPFRPPIA
ncbi:MAG TPA: hypothetical protein VFN25_13350 [Dokdonella sp.]|uniref:hypothetical protein n=1 Tax=Dokdonella sp. TaxID=2291710 RepID=UPI002D810C82|nr:hypothetical protein [Dokdonella sp.]HET9033874.1 hypothetical protein [Dokdonella sp.]